MSDEKLLCDLNLSFANAATLFLPSTDRWRFFLIGCGGTGSWVAPTIARLCYLLAEQGKDAVAFFVDHDHVERKNYPRQNFCPPELGMNKAVALAARYSTAWGVRIVARREQFKESLLNKSRASHDSNLVLVGCVDNAEARCEIANVLKANHAYSPHRVWWVDCGNTKSAGQVIVGSAARADDLRGAFLSNRMCGALPSPALVAPTLLIPRPEESLKNNLSCAEIQLANYQSISINQQVAAVASDYLFGMISGELRKFVSEFDLESGSMASRYIEPEEIAALAGISIDQLSTS